MKIGGPEWRNWVEPVAGAGKVGDKRESGEPKCREGETRAEEIEQNTEGRTMETALGQASWQSVMRVLAEGEYMEQAVALIKAEKELKIEGALGNREAVARKIGEINLPETLRAHLTNLLYRQPGNKRQIRA